MLIPGQNQLAKPEIVKIAPFETLLEELKQHTTDYIAAHDSALAKKVEETFAYESEIVTKLAEAFVVYVQTRDRAYNERITQMLAWWAEGSNLNARLADVGLERQQISPGDPKAIPPVPPTYESDEHARLRYYLAPHAPAAGSRMHYRHEVLTLGERANITVTAPSAGKVVVTYHLKTEEEKTAEEKKEESAANIKDGNARCTAPGKVMVTVLARTGNGEPSDALLNTVRQHFARDDVAPETDEITVQGAKIIEYQIKATVWVNAGVDTEIIQSSSKQALHEYADKCHQLGGRVDRSWIDYVLHKTGAVRVDIALPVASITGADNQAPYCGTNINVEVKTL